MNEREPGANTREFHTRRSPHPPTARQDYKSSVVCARFLAVTSLDCRLVRIPGLAQDVAKETRPRRRMAYAPATRPCRLSRSRRRILLPQSHVSARLLISSLQGRPLTRVIAVICATCSRHALRLRPSRPTRLASPCRPSGGTISTVVFLSLTPSTLISLSLSMSVARPASIARLASAAVARPHATCRRSPVTLPALVSAVPRRPFSTSAAAMSSPYTVVSTSSAPKAIGPYSQAIKHAGLVYTSGAIGFDPETMDIVSPNAIEAQAEQMVRSSSSSASGPWHLSKPF